MNTPRVEEGFFHVLPGKSLDEEWLATRQDSVVECADIATLDPEAMARLVHFEHALAKQPQFKCPVRHYFAHGLYVREIFIPAGVALVGYVHMQECVTTVSAGVIVIGDGNEPRVIAAPYTMACPAGSKKAGYALRDTVWTDSYANPDNERDIDVLEARLTADTHDEFMRRLEHKP